MKRQRLRPAWSAEELASLYGHTHDCHGWRDHRLRVPVTGELAQWMVAEYGLATAADLSCGEGLALDMVQLHRPVKFYGDLVHSEKNDFCGPIEETIGKIPGGGLLICGETIEHLDDPDAFLKHARRCGALVLSTPVGSWDDPTPGHYWAWDREAVEDMLYRAGFNGDVYMELGWPADPALPHVFGIWACRLSRSSSRR